MRFTTAISDAEVLLQEGPSNVDAGDIHTPILVDASELDRRLAGVTAEIATALGLVRVLTLLSLHDASLEELEARLARSWEQLREARQLIDHERRTKRHLRLVPDPEVNP
jgi:hypothetical protein